MQPRTGERMSWPHEHRREIVNSNSGGGKKLDLCNERFVLQRHVENDVRTASSQMVGRMGKKRRSRRR